MAEATDEPAREDARPTNRFMAAMRVQFWRSKLSTTIAFMLPFPAVRSQHRPMSAAESQSVSGDRGPFQFTTTHLSLVIAARDSQAPGVNEALEQLCRAYWHPVYAFVRRTVSNPDDARGASPFHRTTNGSLSRLSSAACVYGMLQRAAKSRIFYRYGGKKAIGRVCQIERHSGSVIPFVRQASEPRFAGRHNGNFGHGKDAINPTSRIRAF